MSIDIDKFLLNLTGLELDIFRYLKNQLHSKYNSILIHLKTSINLLRQALKSFTGKFKWLRFM